MSRSESTHDVAVATERDPQGNKRAEQSTEQAGGKANDTGDERGAAAEQIQPDGR